MTATTRTRAGAARRPDHLPRAVEAPEPSRWYGVLALLGSLVLLVGVPVALVTLVGNPLPTTLPSRDWLTAQVTPSLVIDVLAVLVWIVWTHFAVCFLSEWRSLRRGAMPDHILFGGGSQILARQLVAGILLLAGTATAAQSVTSALAPEPADPPQQSASSVVDERKQAPRADVDRDRGERREAGRKPIKITTVKPPLGRNHDTLWDIAERTLGDPFRYREIFALNKDRLMPDGRRLSDADLIHPGWQLVLPPDAKGLDVETVRSNDGAPARRERPAPADPAPAQPTSPEAQTVADGTAVADRTGGGADTAAAERPGTPASDSSPLASLLLGGGLILAGVVRALTARRGPFGEPDPAAHELAAAAAARKAELLDHALRGLAAQRAERGLDMPELSFVEVDEELLTLHVGSEAEAPDAPWTVDDDGHAWAISADDVVTPEARVAAPYPSLVNVATSEGRDVLVDLETAPGVIALVGHHESARDLSTAMALDLATHVWSDRVDIHMVGFGEHLVELGRGRAERTDDLDALLSRLEDGTARQSAVLQRLGVQGVLQGRQEGAGGSCAPTVVFLSGSPTTEQARRLAALTAGGRTSLSVVCVGDTPSARWRLVVAEDGDFEATALGISGRARRLTVAGQRHLASMLEAATVRRAEGAALVADTTPAQAAGEVGPRPVAKTRLNQAGVTVRLLGPVAVEAPGDVPEDRRALLTETVVMVALHEDGLHQAVLRASLWPRGVEDDVVAARIADAQAWLGRDEHGDDRLRVGRDGRLRLADDVVTDLAALAAAAKSGRSAKALVGGLRLGTGEVFTVGGSSYLWMAFAREARQCRVLVVTTALRAAELAVADGDAALGREALERGLAMVPAAEELWRQLLRLEALHAPEEVDATIEKMYSALDERGVQGEPETAALVQELAPRRELAAGV